MWPPMREALLVSARVCSHFPFQHASGPSNCRHLKFFAWGLSPAIGASAACWWANWNCQVHPRAALSPWSMEQGYRNTSASLPLAWVTLGARFALFPTNPPWDEAPRKCLGSRRTLYWLPPFLAPLPHSLSFSWDHLPNQLLVLEILSLSGSAPGDPDIHCGPILCSLKKNNLFSFASSFVTHNQ